MISPADCLPADRDARSEVWGLSRTDWLIIVLGASVLLANLLAARPLLSANDRSRWATVWSLVERGTFQIDEIDQVPGWSTIDKVQHEGHLYSSKPPLLSTLAAGVSWCLKRTLGVRSENADRRHDARDLAGPQLAAGSGEFHRLCAVAATAVRGRVCPQSRAGDAVLRHVGDRVRDDF